MTLSIAAKYPWGIQANLPGGPGPEAILFATDSRLTHYITGATCDIGEKLLPIGRNAAMVYAGPAKSAEMVVRKLHREFPHSSQVKLKTLTQCVQSEFAKAHLEINRRSAALLGVYDPDVKRTALYGFDSSSIPPFCPRELSGVQCIGTSVPVCQLYVKKLDEFVDSQMTTRGVADNPIEWLSFIAVVLRKVIEQAIAPGVGGLVQTAIVDQTDFRWVTQVKWSPGKGTFQVTQRKNGEWQIVDNRGSVVSRTVKLNPFGIYKLQE